MRHAGFRWLATGFLATIAVGSADAQDTVRVRADGKPLWGETVRLTRELTFGDLNGPEEYAFGSIEYLAVDRSGTMYVFDVNDAQIRQYDAKAKFLGLVGRKGSGPGEYQYPSGMSIVQDSLLVVCDPSNGRISVFGPDRKLRRNVPWTRRGRSCTADWQDRLYLAVPARAMRAQEEAGLNASMQYIRLRPDGTVIDSILVGSSETKGRKFVLMSPAGPRYSFPQERVYAAYRRGGVIGGHTPSYRFFVRETSGPVRLIERTHRPVPLAGPEREEWLAYVEHFKRRDGIDLKYDIPTVKPAFRGLSSDDSGRIWVHLYVAAEKRPPTPRSPGATGPRLTWRERNTYDVFSATGAYLGRIPLEHEAEMLTIRGDRIYVREKGPDWEDRISVYRLPGTPRP